MNLNGRYNLYLFEPQEQFCLSALKTKKSFLADVPCNVETVLTENGLLCDVYSQNPEESAKYELYDWAFEKKFTVEEIESERSTLIFNGVDAIFEVFLNGEKVGEGQNALVEHAFDVSHFIKKGENILIVHIFSAVKKAYEYDNTPITIPTFSGCSENLNVRKASHVYGWDILPRIVSAGITRDVVLRFENKVDFETVYFGTQYLDDDCAMIQFFYNLNMTWRERKHYRMTVNFECSDSKYNFEYPVTFKSHTHFLTLQKPLLWWPNGMGEQNLYAVTVNLYDGEEIIAQKKLNYGVRFLQLKRQPFYGERDNFCFYINGKYFKCLGSNIVPLDVLHSKIDAKYPSLVNALAQSNTNMVRIWGGGVYPSDEFFDLCDKTGIVVWHDFMLSCHSYPVADELQSEFKSEVEKFIKRVRNHPSLGIYCGSNETDWPFYCTGLDPNKDIYTRKIIPDAIFKQDPNRQYLPSSPYFSQEYYDEYGGKFLLDLSVIEENRKFLSEEHYWWHRENFRTFADMKHNFVSEIGYSGCPSVDTINSFSPKNAFPIDAKKFNYTTEGEIDYGVKFYFDDEPQSLDDFVFASQVYQAEAYKYLIEQTRVRDNLNGVLIWTFNEGFPSFTSGIVDYYERKKLAWYFVKNSQEPVQAMVVKSHGRRAVFLTNNTISPVSGEVILSDEKGNTLGNFTFNCAPTSATKIFELAKDDGFLLMQTNFNGKSVYNHYSAQDKYTLAHYKAFFEKFASRLGYKD